MSIRQFTNEVLVTLNADALSRIHVAETSPTYTVETHPPTEQEKLKIFKKCT
jgi:hypothetical protein